MSNVGQAVLDIVGLSAFFIPGLQPFAPLIFSSAVLAGAVLFPARVNYQGPKLADLKTTTVTIGAPLIIPYGKIAVSGNVIYLGLLQTVESDNGGKGSSGGTTDTYYQTVGIALCAGPIIGLLRIWENGKLVYDVRPQQLGETGAQYTARLTANALYTETFVLYLGTTTQLPDPTMEADQGAGNVPGFRGLAYIVYPNRQLQVSQGLHHPQVWKFEVQATGSVENALIPPTYMAGSHNDALYPVQVAFDAINGRYYVLNSSAFPTAGHGAVLGFNVSNNTQFAQTTWASMGGSEFLGGDNLLVAPDGGVIFGKYDTGSVYTLRRLDPLTLAVTATAPFGAFSDPNWYAFGTAVDYTGDKTYLLAGISIVAHSIVLVLDAVDFSSIGVVDLSAGSYSACRICAGKNSLGVVVFWVLGLQSSGAGIDVWEITYTPATSPLSAPVLASNKKGTLLPGAVTAGATGFASSSGLVFDPSDGGLITIVGVTGGAGAGIYLLKLDPSTVTTTWATATSGVDLLNYDLDISQSVVNASTLYTANGGNPQDIYQVDTSSGVITPVSLATQLGSASLGGAWTYNGPTGTMVAWGTAGVYVLYINKALPGATTIASIVTDICARVGITSDQIDVTDLTATVDGYALGRQMTARDALLPLTQIAMCDVVASDTVLRFQKRGKATRYTVEADDLGAYEHGAQAAVEWQSTRAIDTDLPRFIRIHYLAPSRDYDSAEQISPSRMTSSTVNDVSVEIAVAMEDNQAAQVAAIIWQDLWGSREQYPITVDQSLGLLEVADPILVPIAGRNERMRISEIADSGMALRKISLVSDDSTAYSSTAVASAPEGSGNGIWYAADSSLFLIDSPLLRDSDDTDRVSAPLYSAANAAGAGVWHGANIYESQDGIKYAQIAQAPNAIAWATCTTALGDTASPFVTDKLNTVTVQMAAGSAAPASCSTLDLLNGSNPAILIDALGTLEILQFRDVTVNIDGTLTLSYFLRGRRGTDTMTGQHAVGSVMLFPSSANTEVIDLPLSVLNDTLYWKAVASGATLASAPARGFGSIGRSLMPYAPVNPHVSVYSSGDIAIYAKRRTRVGALEWAGSVPLAEDVEQYECDVYVMGAVARTIAASSLPIVYGAVDVIKDFGSPPASLTFELYQISQQVGRGFARQYTCDVLPASGPAPVQAVSHVPPSAPTLLQDFESLGGSAANMEIWQTASVFSSTPTDAFDPSFDMATQPFSALTVAGSGKMTAGIDLFIDNIDNSEQENAPPNDVVSIAIAALRTGVKVKLNCEPANPSGTQNPTGNGDSTFHADTLISGTAHNLAYLANLDVVAAKLAPILAVGPVMFSFMGEMNLPGSYWASISHCSSDQFAQLWAMTWNYLVKVKGCRNMLWLFQPNDGVGNYTYGWPGTQYVDLIGLDSFADGDLGAGDVDAVNQLTAISGGMKFLISSTGLWFDVGGHSPNTGDNWVDVIQVILAHCPQCIAVVFWCQIDELRQQNGLTNCMNNMRTRNQIPSGIKFAGGKSQNA